MFCRNCGTENEDGAKFCRSCGNPIVPAEEIAPETPEVAEVAEAADAPVAAEAAESAESAVSDDAQSDNFTQDAEDSLAKDSVQPDPAPTWEPVPPQGQSVPPQGQQIPPQGGMYQGQPVQPQQNTGTTIGALVLGIVSIVCCCTCIVGLGCGIAAIVMAINERKKGTATSMTTVALVLGIVGVVISVIYGVISAISGAYAGWMDAAGNGDWERIFRDQGYNSYDYWS